MRERIVGSETACRLAELLLKALDEADTNLLGEGAARGRVPLNGISYEVSLIARGAGSETR